MSDLRTHLEHALGRILTAEEVQIIDASQPLPGLAVIAIHEHLTATATRKIHAYINALLDQGARAAARMAADIVQAERLAPGVMTNTTKPVN